MLHFVFSSRPGSGRLPATVNHWLPMYRLDKHSRDEHRSAISLQWGKSSRPPGFVSGSPGAVSPVRGMSSDPVATICSAENQTLSALHPGCLPAELTNSGAIFVELLDDFTLGAPRHLLETGHRKCPAWPGRCGACPLCGECILLGVFTSGPKLTTVPRALDGLKLAEFLAAFSPS